MAAQAVDFSDLGAKPLPPAGQSSATVDFSDLGGKRINDDAADHTKAEHPGVMRRFWNGVKAGTSAEPMPPVDPNRDYLHHPNFANNPMLPGAGVYRDIKSGDYASAAGRVLGPAAELALMVGGGRTHPEPPPERIPLWKQAGIEAGAPPSSYDATPMTPRPVHAQGAPPMARGPVGPRIPLWQRAGIEPGPPPSTVDATPSTPYVPVRAARPMAQPPVELSSTPVLRSWLMRSGEVAPPPSDAAPAQPSQWPPENEIRRVPSVREIQGRRAGVRSRADINDDLAVQQEMRDWLDTQGVRADQLARRESIAGSSPTKTKSDLVREAGGKVEEKPARYTRTPGVKAAGNDYQGVDSNSEKELTDLLKKSLAQAKLKKGK
jgi:hypothetical protein